MIKQRYHDQEFEKLKQSNEDLRNTVAINKRIISQILSVPALEGQSQAFSEIESLIKD